MSPGSPHSGGRATNDENSRRNAFSYQVSYSRGRWILPAGLTALLLFSLPPTLIAVSGWPGTLAEQPVATKAGALTPIAGPAPPTGLPPDLVRWTLVFAAVAVGVALGAWLLALVFRRDIGVGADAPERPRLYLLIFLGLASLSVYGLNFLLPFPLRTYYNLKQVSIGVIADRNGEVALGTALATVAVFLLYTLACRLCRGQNRRWFWVIVLAGAVLFALVNFFVATTTTLDPYDYIARGRITGLHGGNPYVLKPEDYPQDPFTDYVSWRGATSAYGPLWETTSALTSLLAGGQLWPNLLAYKGLALVGYLCSVLLIAAILRRVAPQRALAGTLLFAWNPLILMEGLANGHNDMLMVALLLGAFWALSQTFRPAETPSATGLRWDRTYGWIALVLLAASILIKFIPVLLLPLFLLYLLAREEKWWRWLAWGALFLIPAVLLIAEYYLVFWQWPEIGNTVLRRADMFRMSNASVIKEALQQIISPEEAQAVVTWPFLGAFVVAYSLLLGGALWTQLRRNRVVAWAGYLVGSLGGFAVGFVAVWQGGLARLLGEAGQFLHGAPWSFVGGCLGGIVGLGLWAEMVARSNRSAGRDEQPWDILVRTSLYAFLIYLLLANFWFWPWYLIWPIALLALSGDDRLVAPLAVAACAGEVSHLGWNFVVYWWGITWDTWYQMDALALFWIVVPALLLFAILSLKRQLADRKDLSVR
jgi:hypothetical protein